MTCPWQPPLLPSSYATLISSLSFSAVLLQVSFDRKRFLLTSGVHVIATLVSSSLPFLNTCPIYRHLLILIISSIDWVFVLSLSYWLLILLGQYIRSIGISSEMPHLLMSLIVILQHSDRYINADITLLLKSSRCRCSASTHDSVQGRHFWLSVTWIWYHRLFLPWLLWILGMYILEHPCGLAFPSISHVCLPLHSFSLSGVDL